MAIMRVNKSKDYTVMSNYHLKEKGMSLKAKGLLSLMLSLPDDWDYSISGLVAICKENETAIKSALNELKEFGYLQVIKLMPNQTKSGRIEYIYDVFEQPQKNLYEDIQGEEKQGVGNLSLENPIQLNTKELSTNKSNTNKSSTNNKRRFQKPTIEQIENEIMEKQLNVDAERFYYYYESNGWKVGKNKMKDWKACLRTWNRNNKPRTKQDTIDAWMDSIIRGCDNE